VTVLAVVFALASALTTALSTSVQHIAAGNAPDSARGAVGLLGHLLTRPLWLFGQLLGIFGFVFHGAAMHNGPITLVQPIVVCTIVFAVPVRAAFSRHLPTRREMGAVGLTAAALIAFLLASDPSAGDRNSFGWSFASLVLLGLVVAFVGVVLARRIAVPTTRGFVLGASAGILFGLVAVLLKATQVLLEQDGWVGMLLSWPTLALLVAGLSGVAVNQLSYRTARLSASMPVLNVVDVVVALAFGYVVFQEIPRHDPLALLVEAVALAALAWGLWTLARYEAVATDEDAPVAEPSRIPE
jgi:drug/metabolite transporter (DMT)-like permease